MFDSDHSLTLLWHPLVTSGLGSTSLGWGNAEAASGVAVNTDAGMAVLSTTSAHVVTASLLFLIYLALCPFFIWGHLQLLFVCYLFVRAVWSIGSYSADVDVLYPHTHTLTKGSHNIGNFIPYSSRIKCGFFTIPKGTHEHERYSWDGAYGLQSLSENTWKSNHLRMLLQRQH